MCQEEEKKEKICIIGHVRGQVRNRSLYHDFCEHICHVQHFILIFVIVQFIVTVTSIAISVAILFCC